MKKSKHGGARPGSGRKPKGNERVTTRSISMHTAEWEKLDTLRGKTPRGKFLAGLLTSPDGS